MEISQYIASVNNKTAEWDKRTYNFSIKLLQFGVFLVSTAKAIVGHSAEGHFKASNWYRLNPVVDGRGM
jgi:hypothetical protein